MKLIPASAERLHSGAAGYLLPLRDKCREKIQGTEETDMKRRIALALCVAVGIGLTLMMPEVQVHSAE